MYKLIKQIMKQVLLLLAIISSIIIFSPLVKSQEIRDKHGIKEGQVEEDGDIRDKHGIKIGTAKGVDKHEAAVVFFFTLHASSGR